MTTEEAASVVGQRILCRLSDWTQRAEIIEQQYLRERQGIQQTVVIDTVCAGKMMLLMPKGGYWDIMLGWHKTKDVELILRLGPAVWCSEDRVGEYLARKGMT